MSVGFITYDLNTSVSPPIPGGCSFYRQLLPMSTLTNTQTLMGLPAWEAENGFGIKHGAQRASFGFDTIVMKALMGRNTAHQIRLAQDAGQRIVVDVDDFYDGLAPSNVAYKFTDPSHNKLMNREFFRDVIEACDIVSVSTPFLYDYYSQTHPDVRLVRNGIDLRFFEKRKVRNVPNPVLGWVGAIPWRSEDVETLRWWLPEFLVKHDLMFHHSGDRLDYPPFADLAGVVSSRVTTSPQMPIFQYFQEAFTFDIGIVPLNDIPFNHAKSCIKGLEYAAMGIPFVAQATPEYQWLADSGIGRVAVTPEDWVSHLEDLLDYKTRKREAAKNYTALQQHTMESRDWSWLSKGT